MFKRLSGVHRIEYFPKKASTAMAIGDLLYPDGSGAVQLADSTSGEHVGVCLKTIASTDDDYASTTKIPVDVADPNDLWIVDVGTGTATAALIGTYVDLKDENEADVSATSKKVLFVVGFISSTQIIVKINSTPGVKYIATS